MLTTVRKILGLGPSKTEQLEEAQQLNQFNEGTILQLILVSNGCLDHPSYRAVRRPSADCKRCRVTFEARKHLLLNNVLAPRTDYERSVIAKRQEQAVRLLGTVRTQCSFDEAMGRESNT